MKRDDIISRVREDLAAGVDIGWFYETRAWKNVSKRIRTDDKECLICKARGRYSPAEIAHHVNHLRDRPDLAFDLTYTDADGNEQRNIISLCRQCHEDQHPENLRRVMSSKKFMTVERWD